MLAKIKELTAIFTGGLLVETKELVDWDQVKAGAFIVARPEEQFNWLVAAEKIEGHINQAASLVAELTKTPPIKPPQILVLTRQEWIVLTCQAIKPVIEKMQPLLTEPFGNAQPSRWLKTGLATEVGLALGFLSNHVLGQYDLPLNGVLTDGRIFFLRANIEEAQKVLNVESELLFYWLAAHEYVHYFEFTAFTWLRSYFLDLLNQNISFLEKEVKELNFNEAKGGLLSLYQLQHLENNWALKQTQAFMSLIEGYSDFLTYQTAAFLGEKRDLILSKLIQTRYRRRPWYVWLIEQLLGLDVKKQQYSLGYAFLGYLFKQGGLDLVNQVWLSPKHLPTMAELNNPQWWVKRVSG